MDADAGDALRRQRRYTGIRAPTFCDLGLSSDLVLIFVDESCGCESVRIGRSGTCLNWAALGEVHMAVQSPDTTSQSSFVIFEFVRRVVRRPALEVFRLL